MICISLKKHLTSRSTINDYKAAIRRISVYKHYVMLMHTHCQRATYNLVIRISSFVEFTNLQPHIIFLLIMSWHLNEHQLVYLAGMFSQFLFHSLAKLLCE